jgi:co-chaperonin GroES (HSP10)
MKFEPIFDRIIVKPDEADTVSDGGIVLTSEVCTVKKGNVVLYGKYCGSDIEYEKKEFGLIMREEDILAMAVR